MTEYAIMEVKNYYSVCQSCNMHIAISLGRRTDNACSVLMFNTTHNISATNITECDDMHHCCQNGITKMIHDNNISANIALNS